MLDVMHASRELVRAMLGHAPTKREFDEDVGGVCGCPPVSQLNVVFAWRLPYPDEDTDRVSCSQCIAKIREASTEEMKMRADYLMEQGRFTL